MIMKLLTRNTDYAIRAVAYLARKRDKIVSVPEIVYKSRIPRSFLRKILQVLNKKGIVKSYKGLGGGFRLARPCENIYIMDLIKIFQGPLKLNECFFKKTLCPNRIKCPLKKRIDKIEKFVMSEVGSITIKDLIGKRGLSDG